jgi:arginyl-tRNA synthetase
MYNLEELLRKKIIEAVTILYDSEIPASQIVFQETRKEFEGDITFVVFSLTKSSKKSPEVTAEEIGKKLVEDDLVSNFNVVKGFLNLSISNKFWLEFFEGDLQNKDFGFSSAVSDSNVMVEYSSPNTNKPLHLGHVRNNLLGYSVAEILKANGNKVIKANLVNDRGIHICKSMLVWQKLGNGETPETSGLKGDHLVGKYYVLFDKEYKKEIEELVNKGLSEDEAKKKAPSILEAQQMLVAWENNDSEIISLWKKMNGWVYEGFEKTYKSLGVDFDKMYYESETYLLGKEIVEEGLTKGVFYKKEDDSVWVDLTEEGLDHKLVLRADGTSVYITQDIGTAQLRFDEFNIRKLIYVVGNEQEYHFKVLQLILKKLGKSWADGIFHLSYGMVDLPSGKMKSREGTVVDADDLIEEMISTAKETTLQLGKTEDFSEEEANALYRMIGMGALKYFILKVDPKKRMLFNPAESIDFNGNTGPFLQYTHARIRSILRKYNQTSIKTSFNIDSIQLNDKERELLKHLYKFPAIISEAAGNYSPALVANYAYDLAKAFNQFYHEHSVLNNQDASVTAFRVQLADDVSKVLKKSVNLLGIDMPERM